MYGDDFAEFLGFKQAMEETEKKISQLSEPPACEHVNKALERQIVENQRAIGQMSDSPYAKRMDEIDKKVF